jgi:hypothetical protein
MVKFNIVGSGWVQIFKVDRIIIFIVYNLNLILLTRINRTLYKVKSEPF